MRVVSDAAIFQPPDGWGGTEQQIKTIEMKRVFTGLAKHYKKRSHSYYYY